MSHGGVISRPRAQRQCWAIYDEWMDSGRAVQRSEPAEIDAAFRARTMIANPATNAWMDVYLAAFAEAASLTLVTFDKALASKTKGTVLLA